jgi:L-lysine exporter family protein LysE/ArgO
MPAFFTLLEGFGLGASLIIAIGAQNAFVLRQGLKRQHVFLSAAFCSLADLALIAGGVFGLGALVREQAWFLTLMTWGDVVLRAGLRGEAPGSAVQEGRDVAGARRADRGGDAPVGGRVDSGGTGIDLKGRPFNGGRH